MDSYSGGEQSLAARPRLRGRDSSAMKMAALENGVFDARIDCRSSRAGEATAFYTHGVPMDVIQRWGRWRALTFPPLPAA